MAERKTSKEMDRQHHRVDRVHPVLSCETVARSRDKEEDCIWPQWLLTKKQEEDCTNENKANIRLAIISTALLLDTEYIHSDNKSCTLAMLSIKK